MYYLPALPPGFLEQHYVLYILPWYRIRHFASRGMKQNLLGSTSSIINGYVMNFITKESYEEAALVLDTTANKNVVDFEGLSRSVSM